jgi:methylmalonyl-CoA mutase N-terminal domain/subunit
VSLTAQQPLNNIARTAIEALAGVLGGTQSLHTNSYDEALALPTEDAVRIALRTQQIIAHETGVANTIDPLGGSYFVEALTDRLEEQAYAYFAKIDELGGMVEAVKQNYPQREIADASYELQTEIDAGRRILVGVNAHTEGDGATTALLHIDPAMEASRSAACRPCAPRAARRTSSGARGAADSGGHGRQPHAAAARRRAGPRQRGRDRARAAGRVGRLPRVAGLLARDSAPRGVQSRAWTPVTPPPTSTSGRPASRRCSWMSAAAPRTAAASSRRPSRTGPS